MLATAFPRTGGKPRAHRANRPYIFFKPLDCGSNAITAGPKDGPVVALLHVFPESWYGWHRQIEPLVTAGLRVVVPDQRGYNLSSKPVGVAAYALTELVSDVLAIADQLGQDKIFLAGHDWGAAVAWSTALLHPQRIAKLAVLNIPHPAVMRKFLRTHPRQFFRSWYMFFFQLPWLPEALFSALSFRVGARALLHSSRPGTFSVEDLAQYRGAWSQPGALTGMINWYRALFRAGVKFQDQNVRVSTRILWAEACTLAPALSSSPLPTPRTGSSTRNLSESRRYSRTSFALERRGMPVAPGIQVLPPRVIPGRQQRRSKLPASAGSLPPVRLERCLGPSIALVIAEDPGHQAPGSRSVEQESLHRYGLAHSQ